MDAVRDAQCFLKSIGLPGALALPNSISSGALLPVHTRAIRAAVSSLKRSIRGAPVLVVSQVIVFLFRSMSRHRRLSTSPRRAPVSTSSRTNAVNRRSLTAADDAIRRETSSSDSSTRRMASMKRGRALVGDIKPAGAMRQAFCAHL